MWKKKDKTADRRAKGMKFLVGAYVMYLLGLILSVQFGSFGAPCKIKICNFADVKIF